ncbi:phosphoglycerate mutase-like protein [Xylaria digitata]|nr:phosphoglycerate mutase-like protein [Xylaria digitata]
MLAATVFALLSLSATSFAWEWDQRHEHKSTINYTTTSGFFLQDDLATDPKTFDYTTVNYGLINRSYPTDNEFDRHGKKTQWQRFEHYVNTLNRNADKNTQYKVLFMARHGEGYHNAAESYYGTPAWNCYWGPLDGNGTVVWKDARLTDAGLAQCTKANEFWKHALAVSKIPAPQTYYSSPLTRSATTANLTFATLALPKSRPFVPTVKELLREGISIRSCDERSNKTTLKTLLPGFRFERGFTETDLLWRGDEGETDEAKTKRTKTVLDDIFTHDESTWISLTTHSGQISTSLKVLGHRAFSLSTGQAIPVLVRARTVRDTPSTTILASFTPEATCFAPPVTSIQGQGCVCSSATSAVLSATATPTLAYLNLREACYLSSV